MPIQKSEAFVLRKQELRETSLIITFYTKAFGKIKGILRGVRGPRAQCGGANVEIFALDDIVFYERKRTDIFTVSNCDLVDYFYPVRRSLEKLACAAYMIELLDSVTVPGDANEGVFVILLNSLRLLSGESSAKRAARIFEIKLLNLLGLMPTMELCAMCRNRVGADSAFSFRSGGLICGKCRPSDRNARPISQGTAKFIEHIRACQFETAARIKVSREVGKELEMTLRRFLDYHIERRLKTLSFLNAIE